jgi:type II secretory pathway component PulM
MRWRPHGWRSLLRWPPPGVRLALCLCVVGALLVAAVWHTLPQSLQKNRAQVASLAADLRLIETMRAEMQQVTAQPRLPPQNAAQLEERVRTEADKQAFSLEGWQIEARAPQLVLSGVANFERWLLLVAALEDHRQLSLTQLTLQAQQEPGQVQIDAVLQYGGKVD